MSLHLEFEPHSYYMGFAIQNCTEEVKAEKGPADQRWHAYIDNGNTYFVDEVNANNLNNLRDKIQEYHLRQRNGYGERIAKLRMQYLRVELAAERLSYGDIAELQMLARYGYLDFDNQLKEAAGVAESTV